MEINTLIEVSGQAQVEAGWPRRTFGEDIALIHSEASEALEEYRKGKKPTETYYERDKNGVEKPEGIPVELADIVIRIAALCAQEGIDLNDAIVEKLAYNKTRGVRHGGKVI